MLQGQACASRSPSCVSVNLPKPAASAVTPLRLGFSLTEIGQSVAELWQARDPDTAVARLLQDKLALVEACIEELGQLRLELQQRLKQSCPLRAVGA
ncbi:hypothetical protein PS652_04301 [Pseudomonas fluorescens]|uniref:Transcription regulator MerR DNA binding domain-containing protein n=1 Tax=Pseudomonas fluorescens TaxID=294 RepID=A0A5E6X028_PSEFL|nr:hypothetical protein PS652_05021 [Pseudomonas fluorescens]